MNLGIHVDVEGSPGSFNKKLRKEATELLMNKVVSSAESTSTLSGGSDSDATPTSCDSDFEGFKGDTPPTATVAGPGVTKILKTIIPLMEIFSPIPLYPALLCPA